MSVASIHCLRRLLLTSVLGCVLASLAPAAFAAEEVLRIGYQKSSTLLVILKGKSTLEKVLAPLGVKVQWTEFTSGLPLLEGLNVGSIDLAADVAEPVPLFAQAAGAKLTYLVQETPSPEGQAILVPKNSPLRTVADLKGKKVAVAKAAGSHYLLLESLEKAGLQWKDIEPAYLQPADGRAAFERGAVDAWVVWEPFVAAVQKAADARVLADGRYANVSYRRFYLAATPYATRRPDVLGIVVTELRKAGEWVKQNPREAAEFHAPLIGLDAATVAIANSRRSLEVRPIDEKALAEQQKVADAFTAQGLLPKKIVVRENPVWVPSR
jgi:sulfonate transport system substrate-binding protein